MTRKLGTRGEELNLVKQGKEQNRNHRIRLELQSPIPLYHIYTKLASFYYFHDRVIGTTSVFVSCSFRGSLYRFIRSIKLTRGPKCRSLKC